MDDMQLLEEYTQWVATNKIGQADTSPKAFLEYQMRQVAADRLFAALDYINTMSFSPTSIIDNVKNILEGTYVEPTTETDGDRDSVREGRDAFARGEIAAEKFSGISGTDDGSPKKSK